jgi:short-subunit dehydrogenase
MKSVQDKVIIVAGATGGIGSATAERLARKGATVVIAGRSKNLLDNLHNEIRSWNPNCASFCADLNLYRSWSELIGFAQQRFGKLDGLVHCIGNLSPKDLADMNEEEISYQLSSNFTSVVFAAKAVLQPMLRSKTGHIIVVGSIGGIVPMPHLSLYSATKHAVRGFCFSLHEELKSSGINVSVVSPGPVRTKMLDQEALCDAADISFIGNPLSPHDVAENVLRLLLHPRREVIVPRMIGTLSILSNFIPALFSPLYRHLRPLGYRRRLAYTQQPAPPTSHPENCHVYTH